jgi:hypothetical protein
MADRRRLLIAAGFLVLGLVFGYVSVALGPLGLAEALIVLGLILLQVRRFPERSGAYLVGMSILPVIALASIVSRMAACTGVGRAQHGAAVLRADHRACHCRVCRRGHSRGRAVGRRSAPPIPVARTIRLRLCRAVDPVTLR